MEHKQMEQINCILCNNPKASLRFEKESKYGENFTLKKCKKCNLEFVSPRPNMAEIGKYYSSEYFSNRTERGYNNYFSPEIKNEIERIIELNLKDLDFFDFEKKLETKKALDIGCAAGYFVNYLQNRGWDSMGIDISSDCVDFARSNGLNVENGDYLELDFPEKFDLITLWASIEHLHFPQKFLMKIRNDLKDKGMIFISTCRSGGANFMKLFGPNWRYYNFPEHLFFFSYESLKKLLEVNGFKVVSYLTYGSGVGQGGSIVRKISDHLAKNYKLGDMMLIGAIKR